MPRADPIIRQQSENCYEISHFVEKTRMEIKLFRTFAAKEHYAMKTIKTRLFVLLALLATIATAAVAQNLVINEVMTANLGEALDPSYNFGGWIELYNPSNKSVSLSGMVVADDRGNTHTLTKDHGNVPARGYKCLWFDHYGTKNYGKASYTTQIDFKLDCDGGRISLLQGGTALDAVDYPPAISRCSWARTTDGESAWNYCGSPTPAAANNAAACAAEQIPAPTVSHPGGWIDGTTTFTVSAALPAPVVSDASPTLASVELHYTTDGRVPTAASPVAALDAAGQAHFTVSKNAVYRFRVLPSSALATTETAAPFLPSPVVTRSFITRSYTKTVVDPWDWGGGWDWGDGWDNWGTTEETTTFDGFSLLSIVTDPSYLYDEECGIYVDGNNGGWSYWTYANYYQDWERPVSVEIFDPEGLPLLRQEADMTMSGGYSRMNDPKSFKLKSGKKFIQTYDGEETKNFFPVEGLFPEKPYLRNKDVLVRVGGSSMTDRHQDNALQALARRSGLYIDAQAFRPVYVFFNGEYQETLLLREVSNKQFGASNYGMDADNMDTLEESDITAVTVASGSWDAFNELCDAARQCGKNDASWRRVRELLDVDEYANYFAIELFLANQDWPQNNIKMFREAKDVTASVGSTMCAPEADGGRFHVVLQDLDACFHESGNTFQRIDQAVNYPYASVGNQENVMLTLFFNLMNREEFRKRFVDAFCLVAGSVYEPETASAELTRLSEELSAGYVEKRSSVLAAFTELKSQLSSSWQQKRIDYLRRWGRGGVAAADAVTATIGVKVGSSDNLSTSPSQNLPCSLLLNGQLIPRSRFSGTLFLPATIEARVPAGMTFVGWQKGGNIVSTNPALQLTGDGNFTAIVQPKSPDEYAASSSTDKLKSSSPVLVNEVSPANGIFQSARGKRSDWIELYNATAEPVDIQGLYISDDTAQPEKFQIAESRVIPPYGHIVLWADGVDLPFKLANRDYAAVTITAPDASWSNTLVYCASTVQQSVGRWPDGSADVYCFDRPTIGAPNLYTSYAARLTYDPILVGVERVVADAPAAPVQSGTATYDLLGRRLPATLHSSPFLLKKK